MERCGSRALLTDRGRRLEADEQQDAEQHAAQHAAAGDAEQRRFPRVEHGQRVSVRAALGDDDQRQQQHRNERDRREGEHRADRDAHAQVVEDEHDADGDKAEHPPGGCTTGVGDVRRPEAVGEDAEAEIDTAATQEQRADEEDACGEDADAGVSTVREVLIDSPGARELAGEQRQRVRNREHAEARDQHRQRGIPARPDIGTRDAAQHQRNGEHRADRERLRDGVDCAQPSFAKLTGIRRRRSGHCHRSPS